MPPLVFPHLRRCRTNTRQKKQELCSSHVMSSPPNPHSHGKSVSTPPCPPQSRECSNFASTAGLQCQDLLLRTRCWKFDRKNQAVGETQPDLGSGQHWRCQLSGRVSHHP